MPYDGAVAFEMATFIDSFLGWAYTVEALTFLLIYMSICTNIRSCTEDLRMLTASINEDIDQGRLVRLKLMQFIQLQRDIYK